MVGDNMEIQTVKKIIGSLVVGVASVIGAQAANATLVDFSVSGASGTATGLSTGSVVTITSDIPSAGYDFGLDLDPTTITPSSKTFDFLHVDVSGVGAVAGYVNAVLNFDRPADADATGILGGFAVVFGIGSTGVLSVLTQPGPIAFGNGGLFDVDFTGFSGLCLGLSCGNSFSGDVTATVSLLKEPATSAPEPATISLLGAGLLAIAFSQRRRKLAQQLI